MKSIWLLMVSAGVSGCLSMPVFAAQLAPPEVTQNLFTGVIGPPDAEMRATVVGVPASSSSVGTSTIFSTASGPPGGEAQAGGTTSLLPSPSVVVRSHAEGSGVVPDSVLPSRNIDTGLGHNQAGSTGRIDYQLEMTGPAGPVGLHVDGTIGLSIGGGNASGGANAELIIYDGAAGGNTFLGDVISASSNPPPGQGFTTLNRVWTDNFGIVHRDFTADYTSGSYHEAATYLIQANHVYTIRLVAAAGATWSASYLGSDGSFTSMAFSDPTFSIDAGANSGAYQLLFSEGVGNGAAVPGVPEPGTYALMLAGLGVLGFVTRRRKQRAA